MWVLDRFKPVPTRERSKMSSPQTTVRRTRPRRSCAAPPLLCHHARNREGSDAIRSAYRHTLEHDYDVFQIMAGNGKDDLRRFPSSFAPILATTPITCRDLGSPKAASAKDSVAPQPRHTPVHGPSRCSSATVHRLCQRLPRLPDLNPSRQTTSTGRRNWLGTYGSSTTCTIRRPSWLSDRRSARLEDVPPLTRGFAPRRCAHATGWSRSNPLLSPPRAQALNERVPY